MNFGRPVGSWADLTEEEKIAFDEEKEMDRKKINRYAHRQEDRMEQRFIEMGFELVEDTGRRRTGAGDRVLRDPDTGILCVVDHKSVQSKVNFSVHIETLQKIQREAKAYSSKAIPLVTFGYKGDRRLFAIFDLADLEGVMY